MESKMKYYLLNILFAVSLGILSVSCSELKTNLPVEPAISVHGAGFSDPTKANFHGTYIMENNWNIKECQSCHAADYSGGTTGVSCNSCHTSPGGPTACNTCHGNFNNLTYIAPPRALNGDTLTTYIGVGAHTSHLYSNTLSTVACSSCHNVPQSVFSTGHFNSPAQIVLQGLAVANIASNATFNPSNGSCANTYCHGNFAFTKDSAAPEDYFAFTDSVMAGNNKTVQWTQVGDSEAACGSCHDLPPKGHIGYPQLPLSSCVDCHWEVVDDQGNIIDKTKHINGKVDVRGD
jgi:predicted CxxxxCH...CXXCH cytochrome family protein